MASGPAVGASAKPAGLALRIALWIAQLLLALLFGYAGYLKISQPMTELSRMLVWPAALPPALVRFIGLCEMAGCLGLVLPSVSRVLPILSPIAAIGLATIMGLAIPFHIARGEAQVIPLHLVLGGLAVFVAWGRLARAPIAPRR